MISILEVFIYLLATFVMRSHAYDCYLPNGQMIYCSYGCCRDTIFTPVRCCDDYHNYHYRPPSFSNTYLQLNDRYFYGHGDHHLVSYAWLVLLIIPFAILILVAIKCICFRDKPMIIGRYIGTLESQKPKRPANPVINLTHQETRVLPAIKREDIPPYNPSKSQDPVYYD